MNIDVLTSKKRRLDGFGPLPDALARNLAEWFRVELTYTSNAIEGNTLTRSETAMVVEKGISVGGKSVTEHLEAIGHARAFDWINAQARRQPSSIVETDIRRIHEIAFKGIDHALAGIYRHVPVQVHGSAVFFPNPLNVPGLMRNFAEWLSKDQGLHVAELAAEAHYRLVTIHPFVDSNGRTARLLMNMILLMGGYPPAAIRTRDRKPYIDSLEKAQLGGPKDDYVKIISKAVERSLDICLKAAAGEDAEPEPSDEFLKIGQLARKVGESNSTIRHWTKEGLLSVVDVTPAGYQLYAPEAVDRVKRIHELKGQRLTLGEIKAMLD